jgi:TetR/AcrR family transcriptional repressor of nem operon
MIATETKRESRHESKTRLLDAALHVIRTRGYSATRIEDICEAAGLTKGSFFHHFDSKEALALAAADYWIESTGALFAAAPYHEPADPLERLLAYVDFRKALLTGELPDFTCLVGTMVQEVYDTHPALREACNRSITGHAATLVPDIEEAMRQRGMHPVWTAESLALYTQATIQGAFILAKATGPMGTGAKGTPGAAVAGECIDHLRLYLELLFDQPHFQNGLSHRGQPSPRKEGGPPRNEGGPPRKENGSPRKESASPRKENGSPRSARGPYKKSNLRRVT